MWHGYFVMENLGLNAGQKATLVAALKRLGPARHDQPSHLLQFRPSLDAQAAIFEAEFEDNVLTLLAWRTRLADIFNVAVATVTATTSNTTYATRPSTVVVFKYNAVDRLKVILFGGVSASHEQSADECRAYLAANQAAWETSGDEA